MIEVAAFLVAFVIGATASVIVVDRLPPRDGPATPSRPVAPADARVPPAPPGPEARPARPSPLATAEAMLAWATDPVRWQPELRRNTGGRTPPGGRMRVVNTIGPDLETLCATYLRDRGHDPRLAGPYLSMLRRTRPLGPWDAGHAA